MRMQTITIDLAGPRPITVDLDSVPDTYQSWGRSFTRVQLAIVGAALNAGVFYQEAIRDACRDAWAAAHPVLETCLTRGNDQNWQVAVDDFQERRVQIQRLEAQLASAPRGTWVLLRREWQRGDGETFVEWIVRMASGVGVESMQTNHLKQEPTHRQMVEAMEGYEIYLARKAEEDRRSSIESKQVIDREGWSVGARIKNLRIGGVRYANGIVESVHPNNAMTLLLTKRGSAKRYRWTGLAQRINWSAITSVIVQEVGEAIGQAT